MSRLLKILILIVVLIGCEKSYSRSVIPSDSNVVVLDIDSVFEKISNSDIHHTLNTNDSITENFQANSLLRIRDIIANSSLLPIDTLLLRGNPLFISLVLKKPEVKYDWKKNVLPYSYYFPTKAKSIVENFYCTKQIPSNEDILKKLRENTLQSFVTRHPELFEYYADKLPSTDGVKNRIISAKKIEGIEVFNYQNASKNKEKISLKKPELNPWKYRANSMLQFTQNYVSKNWHQGGSQNIAILGILNGQLNYDNKENIQWENSSEWRTGFNTVSGDTLRFFNTNDDIFKLTSKLGLKAGGKWFYSGSVDFSTQFFNNYKAVNSTVMKAAFLTPVRLNISAGIDYKYKKLFSLMISPISFKYIYANDIVNVSPNLFGIKKGENTLSQIGSSLRGQFSYSPAPEIQIDSKFLFYTNYEKIEVDWEVVGIFTVNRFLSTRLSINPRYDNTMILKPGEKAKMQFKEFLSFGFSHRLID